MTLITYLKKIINSIYHDRMSSALRLVLLCVVVGLGIGSYYIYHDTRSSLYVATQDNFEINFPGVPKISPIPSQSDGSGGTENGRIYSVVVNTGSKAGGYTVYVNHYSNPGISTLSNSATKMLLEADTEYIAGIEKANITKPAIITFDNLVAAEAILTPTNKTDGSTYILTLLKQHNVYIILGTGLSQSSFDTFIDSFHFLN